MYIMAAAQRAQANDLFQSQDARLLIYELLTHRNETWVLVVSQSIP